MPITTQPQTANDATTTSMGIRLYNTLTRRKEPLEPLHVGQVGIYLCGPTVYKPSHIGHMVGPVIFDTIKRYLVHCGYEVTWVVNVTDVDDKLIAEAQRRGMTMSQVAGEMTEDYLNNLRALGVDGVDHFPKATDNIGEIITFIESLLAKQFAYVAGGDVYFEVSKDSEYGKLSGRNLENMQGEGGETSDRKRNANDFALWKRAKPNEPGWDSPWGPGRPGWHIECSAMSRSLLGETFDIHGGGLDLVFPHHENEIAQSESCHGKPMAKYWMHNGLMQASEEIGKVGGRETRQADAGDAEAQAATKISKSTGSRPFRELLEVHQAETIRFFLLATHYRRPIDFSDRRIEEVQSGLDTFYRFFKRYQRITGDDFYALAAPTTRAQGDSEASGAVAMGPFSQHRQKFLTTMDDDFNTGAAIGELFELVRALNKFCDDSNLETSGPGRDANRTTLQQGAIILRELSATLGLFRIPTETTRSGDDALVGQLVSLLIDVRSAARKNKDFTTSDQIRDALGQLGIVLEDRPNGTDWSMG